jgi:hypothetical protein
VESVGLVSSNVANVESNIGETHDNTQPEAGTSGAVTTHAINPEFERLKPLAKKVYQDERKFHGTDRESKASITANGFRMSKKTNANVWDTDKFHYLAPQKMTAALYAKPEHPAIVRTIGAHTNKHRASSFEAATTDPAAYNEWIRTPKDIKSKHILGSKRSPPGANAEVFHDRLKRAGVEKIDTATAGRLLREVQSDSEDDFSDRE